MSYFELSCLFLILMVAGCTAAPPPAEIVIRNGTIYTANDRQPRAEAIAVSGGKILFVGSNTEVAA